MPTHVDTYDTRSLESLALFSSGNEIKEDRYFQLNKPVEKSSDPR